MESGTKWLGSSLLVLWCIVFVLPLYSVEGYGLVHNDISDLGAQNSPYSWIINVALTFYAICIAFASFSRLALHPIRWGFLSSAILLILAAILRDAPMDSATEHNELAAAVHPILFSASAIILSLTLLLCAILRQPLTWRLICLLVGAICLSLAILRIFLEHSGITDRIFVIISGSWLYFYLLKSPWNYIKPVERVFKATR